MSEWEVRELIANPYYKLSIVRYNAGSSPVYHYLQLKSDFIYYYKTMKLFESIDIIISTPFIDIRSNHLYDMIQLHNRLGEEI